MSAQVAEATPVCYRHKDRETLVSCSSCERPICTECMVASAVGMRCPECAGRPTGMARMAPRALPRGAAYATKVLIGLNVLMFVLQVMSAGGSAARGVEGRIAQDGWLIGFEIANGEWWRIVTSAFLHGGVFHLGINMLSLWILGSLFEPYVGPLRFSVVYVAAVVCGSFGATLLTPNSPTVGASGGVFGLMAAMLVLQWQRRTSLFGDIGIWLILNLVITFTIPNISVGGHIGGLIGGAAAAFALSGFGKGHMAGRKLPAPALIGAVAVIVIGFVGTVIAANARTPKSFGAVPEPAVIYTASSCACSSTPTNRSIDAAMSSGWQASTLV